MFGLGGFSPRFVQAAEDDAALPVILVSTEDIYRALNKRERNRQMEPVLLLKKGLEVAATQLPRFIKNGANPSQFRIKPLDGEPMVDDASAETTQSPAQSPMTNPLRGFPASVVKAIRSRKRVLMLDPDQKSLKRLIDCLFICGFQLDNLHPLRVPSSLTWAINKYTPHVLVVDYHLSDAQNGLYLLQQVPSILDTVEQVILTIPPRQELTPGQFQQIEAFCSLRNVKILPKPVSRFTLKVILDRMLCETNARE